MSQSAFSINAAIEIPVVDLMQMDIFSAHFALGQVIGVQVRKILERKLKINGKSIIKAKELHKTIESKIHEPGIPSEIRSLIIDYLECLRFWSKGAGLGSCTDDNTSPLELGLLLQDDNTGCQTGFFRNNSGAVDFWHTEEDQDVQDFVRVDQPRIIRFSTRTGSEFHSFIYPDLLPGSTFNWSNDGRLQLVDALLLKDVLPGSGLHANLFAWIYLNLPAGFPLKVIFSSLKPFFDGYALFSAFIHDDKVVVERIEFCRNEMMLTSLDDAGGSWLFQVNIFSEKSTQLARKYERDPFPERLKYLERIKRTSQVLNGINGDEQAQSILRELIRSKVGGDFAYDNPDVKASLIGNLSSTGVNINTAPGCGV